MYTQISKKKWRSPILNKLRAAQKNGKVWGNENDEK
jgi:hypothetical protein